MFFYEKTLWHSILINQHLTIYFNQSFLCKPNKPILTNLAKPSVLALPGAFTEPLAPLSRIQIYALPNFTKNCDGSRTQTLQVPSFSFQNSIVSFHNLHFHHSAANSHGLFSPIQTTASSSSNSNNNNSCNNNGVSPPMSFGL